MQNHVLTWKVAHKRLVYMKTHIKPDPSARQRIVYLILMGGLTDPGIQGLPYVDTLAEHLVHNSQALPSIEISFIQPWLSSSLYGYGAASLDQDVKELDVLLDIFLKQQPTATFVLLGHSTGAQIVVKYLKSGRHVSSVMGAILQGPVSDREYAEWKYPQDLETWLPVAKDMIASGKSNEFMPRCVDEAPMTAYRYHSLYSKGGDDDMFSSDVPLEDYHTLYQTVPSSCHIMLLFSEKDEYVPPHVNVEKDILMKIAQMCPAFRFARILKDADHAISDKEKQIELCQLVSSFIAQIYT